MDERVQGEKESELKAGLHCLGADANNLRAEVKQLACKLSPVMREIQRTPKTESVVGIYSPTGQQIKAIMDTIDETRGLVCEIMQHLEV